MCNLVRLEVWYHSGGVAKIMSVKSIRQLGYYLKYDNNMGGGLHYADLNDLYIVNLFNQPLNPMTKNGDCTFIQTI